MRSHLAFLTVVFSIGLIPFVARAQWPLDGVVLCTAANSQYTPTIVPDGAGGAIVTWHDYRSGTNADIYAQRVNASGVPQWTADGVALCTAASDQHDPTVVSDGAGGAVITWLDDRNGLDVDIYTQRVNASGVPQWTADGVALCTAANSQYTPTIVSDGAGGAIVTWSDYRSGTSDIYAQQVNASGVPQWTADGVALTAASDQYTPTIVSDGAGGAIITWLDDRNGLDIDIYTQRVDASGVPQWTADGVALCAAASDQHDPTIVSDDAGGAIVTWYDDRSGASDIYAQRVDASGAPQWTADGVALCSAANTRSSPTIVSDGAAGAIVTWYDYRSGTNSDIYARRVNASGVPQWTADGVALCTAASNQYYPTIVSDGAGGAIVTWQDYRSGTNFDIYAQRVDASGYIPTAVAGPMRGPSLVVSGVYPNPFSGTASMDIGLTAPSTVGIDVFDVAGRWVRSMTLSESVSHRVEFDGRDDANRLLPSGVYFYRVTANGGTITRKMVIAR
jgi:Secretion system C-terminal sorting domain